MVYGLNFVVHLVLKVGPQALNRSDFGVCEYEIIRSMLGLKGILLDHYLSDNRHERPYSYIRPVIGTRSRVRIESNRSQPAS